MRKGLPGPREPFVITERWRAAAVLLGIEACEGCEQGRDDLLKLLGRGEKEIGEGTGGDFASVLGEADGLLAAE